MDIIHIRNLKVRCIVGTDPAERRRRRTLPVQIALQCDLSSAGKSDRLVDTIDYRRLSRRVVRELGGTRFLLIESVAEGIAALCLQEPGVCAVTVTVDKPGALAEASSVAVEVCRAGRRRRGG